MNYVHLCLLLFVQNKYVMLLEKWQIVKVHNVIDKKNTRCEIFQKKYELLKQFQSYQKFNQKSTFFGVASMATYTVHNIYLPCLWACCRAKSNWKAIHFFSIKVRKGRVEILS